MKNPAKFGTILGKLDGVDVHSSDYDSCHVKNSYPVITTEMKYFLNYHDGIYTGAKDQCVEFARRYLLIAYGVVFDSVDQAYMMFNTLKSIKNLKDEHFELQAFNNGSKTWPQKGSLLIWDAISHFHPTGHVAIVSNVQNDFIDICEQNVHDSVWEKDQNYSRRLKVNIIDGAYHIKCSFEDAKIIGWMNLRLDLPTQVEKKEIRDNVRDIFGNTDNDHHIKLTKEKENNIENSKENIKETCKENENTKF